jgi:hypothetical protein
MGMRRTYTRTETEAHFKPLMRVYSFDDSSIRKMLRSAYDDFVGDELELQVDNNLGVAIFPEFANQGDQGWAGLSHMDNRADLQIFWNMFVQKQILCFDQESLLLMNLPYQQPW